jgi:hypothetical protein
MSGMFYACGELNQPLAFDTARVEDMSEILAWCVRFNQPLAWDTRNVRDMRNMFLSASSLAQVIRFDMRSVVRDDGIALNCPRVILAPINGDGKLADVRSSQVLGRGDDPEPTSLARHDREDNTPRTLQCARCIRPSEYTAPCGHRALCGECKELGPCPVCNAEYAPAMMTVREDTCAVCLDRMAIFAPPCGHLALCGHCADVIVSSPEKRCPLCRATFIPSDLRRVYSFGSARAPRRAR